MNKRSALKLLSYSGIIAAILAWLTILTSIALNPDWIAHYTSGAFSDLGTPGKGIKFPFVYNYGLIFTSLFSFIYSCFMMYRSRNKIQVAGSSFFIVASIFLALIGVYHGGTYPHLFVSGYFFAQADISIITIGIGLMISKQKYGLEITVLGILSPVLAFLIPFASSAEAETFGIIAIDIFVVLSYYSFKS